MLWFETTIPSLDVIQADLESRGIDYTKWEELAKTNDTLSVKLSQCYAKHNFGHRHFDQELHAIGVRLRLDIHCQWLLQEYPSLAHNVV